MPAQAVILAVGAVAVEGRIVLARACDHPVLDGAPAAGFLGDIVDRLQAREWLEGLS